MTLNNQYIAVKRFAYNRGLTLLKEKSYNSYKEFLDDAESSYDILELWVFSSNYRNMTFEGYREIWDLWNDYKTNNKQGIPFYKDTKIPWLIRI